jgi:threonine dehydrogenase-like Zn-dependent dehydrogenase
MKALTWHGINDVRIDNVDDPEIEEEGDVIIKVTSTAICGSDLHLLAGTVPTMEEGDVLGHEFMGEIVETGSDVTKFDKGDRVVVPFTIACGHCHFCENELYSLCDNANRNPDLCRENMGSVISGAFGYSHMLGGFAGGQAEYVRVPYANVGPVKVPDSLEDKQVLFLSDIFPTGYMAAENADIEDGDTVAIWGCGPVGQFAIQSAWMMGAERVVAIDSVPERLDMAENHSKAEVIRTTDSDEVFETLQDMTDGYGPDCCIDAVGAEAHGGGSLSPEDDRFSDKDKPYVLQQIIPTCKKGGNVSVPGVYAGMVDGIPFGAAMNKSLSFKMGQTHMQHYMKPLLERVEDGEIDPSFIITHQHDLEEAPQAYEKFRDKEDGCVKVVLTP